MENKIQQLTEQLYNEGVAKGKAASETIINDATESAAKIIAEANAKADNIIKDAEQKAQQSQQNTIREINLAARQMTGDLKHYLETAVTAASVSADVKRAFEDASFIKQLIMEVVKTYGAGLKLAVSDNQKADIEKYLKDKIGAALDSIEIVSDSGIVTGFKVSPKEGGYYISFSDKEFDALFKEYLRPKVIEILYGDK